MIHLTQARLKEVLHYDPVVGIFLWKSPTSTRVKIGDIPTPMKSRPYVQIRIDGKRHYAHRLAWLWQTGEFPALGLDHRNTIKSDNALSNLRVATDTQNGANKGIRRDSSTGIKGVRKCKKTGKWVARLKGAHLGAFQTQSLASEAYDTAATREYGEFFRKGGAL